MTTYEKIREIRNERLYDGKPPLEPGCELIYKNNKAVVLHKTVGGAYVYFAKIDSEDTIDESIYIKKKYIDFNVGKQVSWSDVLRLLHFKERVYSIDSYGDIMKYQTSDYSMRIETNIDLTKTIKDQEEETLKQLLELIK